MRKTIAEIILLWLGIGLLCPSIAFFLLCILFLPTQKAEGQIIAIFSSAMLAFFLLCFL